MVPETSWTLDIVYQPIFDIQSSTLIGFEALTRDRRPRSLGPEALFDEARAQGRLFELEMFARRRAIEERPLCSEQHKLFINVSPDILMDPGYQQGLTLHELHAHGLPPETVVLEISERFRVYEPQALADVITHYQRQGFSVALDDFGAGYANLSLLSEIEPRFLKLDRTLVDGIQRGVRKQRIVQAMVTFASASGCQLIAEGIEDMDDLAWLQDAGVPYGQGYLLGRPGPQYEAQRLGLPIAN